MIIHCLSVSFYSRRPFSRTPPPNSQEVSKNKKEDDEEDNWDLPAGDIPY